LIFVWPDTIHAYITFFPLLLLRHILTLPSHQVRDHPRVCSHHPEASRCTSPSTKHTSSRLLIPFVFLPSSADILNQTDPFGLRSQNRGELFAAEAIPNFRILASNLNYIIYQPLSLVFVYIFFVILDHLAAVSVGPLVSLPEAKSSLKLDTSSSHSFAPGYTLLHTLF
jgi:hypothetical protein